LKQADDSRLITLLFHHQEIAEVFADLIGSMGYKPNIIQSDQQITKEATLITEPLFFRNLGAAAPEKCLVIGDGATLEGITAKTISRPLTPQKIESGLRSFLE
jgi:hypothetical protein